MKNLEEKRQSYGGEVVSVRRNLIADKVVPVLPKVGEAAVCNIVDFLDENLKVKILDPTECFLPPTEWPSSTPHSKVHASDEDMDTEFLDLVCALHVVEDEQDALRFIRAHGSGHTESIVTQNHDAAMRFLRSVDASCVMVNASTRFNDGGELGLGAELGISTSKLHAYGPMGLEELCTKKFVVLGHGETRGSPP